MGIRASLIREERRRNKKDTSKTENSEEEYLVSDIVQGYTHLYEKVDKEKRSPLCSDDKVKTDNLKTMIYSIEEMKHKICEDCLEKAKS